MKHHAQPVRFLPKMHTDSNHPTVLRGGTARISKPAGNCIIQEDGPRARESSSIMMTGCSEGLGRARLGLSVRRDQSAEASGLWSWSAHDAWHRFRVAVTGRLEILPRSLERNCATPTASRIIALPFVFGPHAFIMHLLNTRRSQATHDCNLPNPQLLAISHAILHSSRSSVIPNFSHDIQVLKDQPGLVAPAHSFSLVHF